MERPITLEELEAVLVRSCAPVLLGAKPANLFTFCGCFDEKCPDCNGEGCHERQRLTRAQIAKRREKLALLVAKIDAALSVHGMRCRIVAWRPFGALLYGYRPVLVKQHMNEASVAHDLSRGGYPVLRQGHFVGRCARRATVRRAYEPVRGNELLESCIERLVERFKEQAVPHEIGYFLGYPASDVRGFIEHEGREFLCCGCWKVYADVRGAQYRFSRYRRCTRRAMRLYKAGASLTDLARDPAVKVA